MAEVGNAFESSEYLASWASKETANFTAMREAFFAQPDACTRVVEFDPDTGLNVDKLIFNNVLPTDMRGLASNAVKNFRDALDQAVFAASYLISGKRSNQTHFPFGESPDDLEYSLSRKLAVPCKGIREELFPALRASEPYPTSDDYPGGNDILRLLGRVSGPNKHAITLTVKAQVTKVAIGGRGGVMEFGPGGAVFTTGAVEDGPENEVVLFRFPPGGYVKADSEITLLITFGPGPLEQYAAEHFLHELAAIVPVVIDRLKKATADVIRDR